MTPNAPVLEKITVLTIGDYTANVQQDGGVEIMSYASLTLEVTKEQITKLLTVENGCRIALVSHAESYGLGDDLVAGANIAGFVKVAEAMKAQGAV